MDPSTVGIVPERTDTPAAAALLLARDGAAILTGRGTDEATAQGVATDVLGDLLALPDACAVVEGGDQDRGQLAADELMPLHSDGFAYGDHHPDGLFLLCAHQGTAGGDSLLADGYAVLDALADEDPELHAFVHDTVIDLSEPGMQPTRSPIVLRLPGGRRAVRRTPFMAPSPEAVDPDHDAALIERWRALGRELSESVPRARIEAGEALCIDNYRVLHGRGPFEGERFLWRIWAWTPRSNGTPSGPLHSDSRYASA
jgi:gamma-butyrobetaine dioxygenase